MEDEKDIISRVYELGYHIISSVPEENLGVEIETLKGLIKKHGGEVISEAEPEIMDLAYTMRKRFESGYQSFDRSYFGWVKFEMASDAAIALKADLDEIESLLRYLITKTVKENTLYTDRVAAILSEQEREDEGGAPAATRKKDVPTRTAKEEKAEKGEVQEEELDEKLDELVSDDTPTAESDDPSKGQAEDDK